MFDPKPLLGDLALALLIQFLAYLALVLLATERRAAATDATHAQRESHAPAESSSLDTSMTVHQRSGGPTQDSRAVRGRTGA
jgi:hypothetical protein